MAGNISGVASYQQTNQIWKATKSGEAEKTGKASDSTAKDTTEVKVSEWKPMASNSPLVPTTKKGYGAVVGNVELSDKAKDYYDKLKSKFHGMDFVLVSKDLKSQVAANASSYGNANKPVVLIDDEKLEKMANDPSYRKKYEGIIAMSQTKLQEAKNSLTSSGAGLLNFGMSVDSNGKTSFFATVAKSNIDQAKALAKKQAEKKAAKAKEKKKAEKKAEEERIEKRREENEVAQADEEDEKEASVEKKEYIEFKADSIDDLISQVTKYAYDNSAKTVRTEEETKVGQNVDFRG